MTSHYRHWIYLLAVLVGLRVSLTLPGGTIIAQAVHPAGITSPSEAANGSLSAISSRQILQSYVPPVTKIDDGLYTALTTSGSSDFIVQMSEQANLDAAYTMSDRDARATWVYQTLVDTATRVQKPVITYLQKEGYQYQTFIASNEIYVFSGDLNAANSIEAIPEVSHIRTPATYYLDLPALNIYGPQQKSTVAASSNLTLERSSGPGLDNTSIDWGIVDTKTVQFWNTFGLKGDGIVVANIDTGVQWDHPALANQFKCPGQPDDPTCWNDPTNICGPDGACDNLGHGTLTMGIMVAKDDPNLPYTVGMAPNAKWIACKGCENGKCSETSLNACADWILAPGGNPANHPDIVNNSWSGPGNDSWFTTQVNAWRAEGIFPTFSAGNTGPACASISSPGDYQQSFATGAYDAYRTINNSSGRGPSSFGDDPYTKPNISAPGVNICSTLPTNSWDCTKSGTSVASPHSAGAVALLWSCNPALRGNIDQTFQILQNNADASPAGDCNAPADMQGNYTFGYGYLNVFKAGKVACAASGVGSLMGTVKTTAGVIEGATVTAKLDIAPYTTTTALTNNAGVYSLSLPAGVYTVTAVKYSFNAATVNGIVIVDGGTAKQDFSLVPANKTVVKGTVKDGNGHGYPLYAKIVVTSLGFTTTTYTDPYTGGYSVTLYQQTDYTFTIDSFMAGYRQKKIALTFSDATVTRDYALEVDSIACAAPGYRPVYRYYQDFESSGGEFVPYGTNSSWKWGGATPKVGPEFSHSGSKMWGASLNGHYNDNENSSITSPSIDLTGAAGQYIIVQWWQWGQVESGNDNVYVDVSSNGGKAWTQVYTFSGIDVNWKRQQVTLNPSYGVVNFKIRFRLVSNNSLNYAGYYIDDIGIGFTTAITENFEGGTFPPPGWSVYQIDSNGTTWSSSTAQARSATHSVGHYWSAKQEDWLVSPPFYVPADPSTLSFWEYTSWPNFYVGHYLLVCDESSQGGCGSPPFNYSQLYELGSPAENWRSWTVALPGYTGHTLRLAWRYIGDNADAWYVDDVSGSPANALQPLECAPITGGLVAGITKDGNTNLPLSNVLVSSDTGGHVTSVATPDDSNMSDGFYEYFQNTPAALHNLTITGPGHYGSGNASVLITNNTVSDLDLFVPAGQLGSLPSSISITIDLGSTATRPLNLQNLGGWPINWQYHPYNSGFTPSLPVLNIPPFSGKLPPSNVLPSLYPLPGTLKPFLGVERTGAQNSLTGDVLRNLTSAPAFAFDIGVTPSNLVSFTSINPGSWNVVGNVAAHIFTGGDFAGGDYSKMYVLDVETNRLYTVSTSSAEVIEKGVSIPVNGQVWTGLKVTMDGQAYAVSAAPACTGSELYTINLDNGNVTPIGMITNAPCVVDIAIDTLGHIFGVDIANDNLVSLNPSTAAGTIIGSLGVDANLRQGLAFEQQSGILYWAAYLTGQGAQLRVIDTVTGASALVGAFPTGSWVDSLAFATGGGSSVPWLAENPAGGNLVASSSQSTTIIFTAPADVSGLGTYRAELRIGNDTPYNGLVTIPITMTVRAPDTWSVLAGTVTGLGLCDTKPGVVLAGARVEIRDTDDTLWGATSTDANGQYHYPVQPGTYKIIVTHLNYVANQVSGVSIPGSHGTVTQDLVLSLNQPCVVADKTSLNATLFSGNSTTVSITLSNTGAGAGYYALSEKPTIKVDQLMSNPLQDPSFELYTSSSWVTYSQHYASELCIVGGDCTTGNFTSHVGDVWAFLGGYSGGVEEGYVKQNVTIPIGKATLSFWLAMPSCNTAQGAGDYFVAQIDGNEVFRKDANSSLCGVTTYTRQTVDLTIAKPGIHELKFYAHTNDASATLTNFYLDDVSVEVPGYVDLPWLSESTALGPLPAGNGSQTVTITFDATGLSEGTYTGILTVEAITKPSWDIPVTLVVGGAPNKITPINGAVDKPTSLVISWNASSIATSYEYCYSTAPGCQDNQWINVGNQTSVNLSGLKNGTTYYWQVRAVNSGGMVYANGGVWWSFTVERKLWVYLPIIVR